MFSASSAVLICLVESRLRRADIASESLEDVRHSCLRAAHLVRNDWTIRRPTLLEASTIVEQHPSGGSAQGLCAQGPTTPKRERTEVAAAEFLNWARASSSRQRTHTQLRPDAHVGTRALRGGFSTFLTTNGLTRKLITWVMNNLKALEALRRRSETGKGASPVPPPTSPGAGGVVEGTGLLLQGTNARSQVLLS